MCESVIIVSQAPTLPSLNLFAELFSEALLTKIIVCNKFITSAFTSGVNWSAISYIVWHSFIERPIAYSDVTPIKHLIKLSIKLIYSESSPKEKKTYIQLDMDNFAIGGITSI